MDLLAKIYDFWEMIHLNRIITTLLLLFYCSMFSTCLKSQDLGDAYSFCDTCSQALYLRFESTSFIKNNEYNNAFAEGYTGIGFFAKPILQYYFTPSTRANAGIYLLKYSGRNGFSQSIPIFSVTQRLTPYLDLVIGNINGTLFHQLEEPMYRFDQYYQQNIEYGLQLLFDKPGFTGDMWLNWEKFIFKDDPFQESFQAGTRMQMDVLKSGNFRMSLPVQWIFYHKGGQIDQSPEPILTIFNGGIGMDFMYEIKKESSFRFNPYFFIYQGLSVPEAGVNAQRYDRGNALYLKLIYEQPKFRTMIGYWKGYQFIAPRGEYLFQSVSEYNPTVAQKTRQLINAKFNYKYEISSSIRMEVRLDMYYDIFNKNLAHAASFFLVIDDSIFLTQSAHQR